MTDVTRTPNAHHADAELGTTCGWAGSWRLELRAYCWMIGALLPLANLLAVLAIGVPSGQFLQGAAWGGLIVEALGWAVLADGVAAVFTVGAAIVVIPLTQALALLLRRVRSRAVHIAASSFLAGTLAAVPLAFIGSPQGADWFFGIVVFVPISIAAGAAGAIARRGEFRRADRQPQDEQERAPDATT
jgi:hypothetical protein